MSKDVLEISQSSESLSLLTATVDYRLRKDLKLNIKPKQVHF